MTTHRAPRAMAFLCIPLLIVAFMALVQRCEAGVGNTFLIPWNESESISWSATFGEVRMNGRPFHIKGISWFGIEQGDMIFHGLANKSLDSMLDLVGEHFNAMRLPFSVKFALTDPETTFPLPTNVSHDLKGLTTWDVFDLIFEKSKARGIFILLDMHLINYELFGWSSLWYQKNYTESVIHDAWDRMMNRYGHHWNLFGLDIRNEPHDKASWGDSQPATDYNKFCERAIKKIAQNHPEYNGLYYIEGTQNNYGGEEYEGSFPDHWWGGNFEGAKTHPIDVGTALNKKVVYSPHVYGPMVWEQPYHNVSMGFPDNLFSVWDDHFGWLEERTKNAVVIGEWGGGLIGKDNVTQHMLGDYLVQNCMSDNFWWSLNPTSADTGGILEKDWKTMRLDILAIVNKAQPYPTRARSDSDGLHVSPGKYANPECAHERSRLMEHEKQERQQAHPYRRSDRSHLRGKTSDFPMQ